MKFSVILTSTKKGAELYTLTSQLLYCGNSYNKALEVATDKGVELEKHYGYELVDQGVYAGAIDQHWEIYRNGDYYNLIEIKLCDF